MKRTRHPTSSVSSPVSSSSSSSSSSSDSVSVSGADPLPLPLPLSVCVCGRSCACACACACATGAGDGSGSGVVIRRSRSVPSKVRRCGWPRSHPWICVLLACALYVIIGRYGSSLSRGALSADQADRERLMSGLSSSPLSSYLPYSLSSPLSSLFPESISTIGNSLNLGVSAADRPGMRAAKNGTQAHFPVVFVPGIISSGLEVWKGKECVLPHFRQRLWGSSLMIRALLLDSACWMEHLKLNSTTGLDPDGIKLRAATGLEAADYFISNYWIWSKIIENLADIARYSNGNRKVVILCHSMGGNVLHYFFKWCEAESGGKGGRNWVAENVHAVVHVAAPLLGVPKSFSALYSGEMRDTAELVPFLDYWRQRVLMTQEDVVHIMRAVPSVASMLPRGSTMVWGDADAVPSPPLPSNPHPPGPGESSVSEETARSSSAPPSKEKFADAFEEARSFFLSFSNTSIANKPGLSVDEALDLLRASAPELMNLTDQLWSHGHEYKEEFNEQHRYWGNVLQHALPHAPEMTIYCLYGVDRDTERGYWYQSHSLFPLVTLNTSVNDPALGIKRGVKLTDGDGTVPLVSLGYMPFAWKRRDLNPSQMRIVSREYREVNRSMAILRSAQSTDHVDIIGNSDLIADILDIVGINSHTQRTLEHRVENRIFSSIAQIAKRVNEKFIAAGYQVE